MKSTLHFIFQWLVRSSADPKAVALSVKGFLVLLVPFTISVLGLQSEVATTLVDQIVNLTYSGLIVIGGILSFVGFIRKIMSTIDGTNQFLVEQDQIGQE